MEHIPPAITVTVDPATVQTLRVVDAKPTVSPELEVAEIVNGATPKVTLGNAGNVIVCAALVTVKV